MAEILYADGRKETVPFLNPPAGQQEIRAPTAFETYRSGRQAIFEKPLKALGMPEGAAESVGEFMTPQTTAEQGIELGTLAMPGAGKFASKVIGKTAPLVERGVRYAAPAVGGLAGDIAGRGVDLGHNLWEMARGLAYGVGGDLLPVAKGLWQHGGQIERADERAVGGAIEQAVPAFGKVSSKSDLDAIGVRSRGDKALEESRTSFLDSINESLTGRERNPSRVTDLPSRKSLARLKHGTWQSPEPPLGNVSIDVPSLSKVAGGGSMTIHDAAGWLSKLSDRGWLLTNQLATGLDASSARALREKARGEIVGALNKAKDGLGTTFDQGMNELAKGHLFVRILQQPGVISDGKLDMNTLRDVMTKMATQKETFGQRLEKLAKPAEVKQFYDALTRGSGDLTARDVPGKFLKVGAHLGTGGRPHFWLGPGQLPKHVGAVPPVKIGPGGTPTSFGLMGLSRETAESEER